MNAAVDYTHKRLHSKPNGRPIEVCQKCGRKGERTVYTDGDRHYVHKARIGVWGLINITDSCYIKKGTHR